MAGEAPVNHAKRNRFDVTSGRSAVLLEARSTVGPIAFGTTSVDGVIEVSMSDGAVDLDEEGPAARLQIELKTFSSGNSLYDAELLHRIDPRQHPMALVELRVADRIGR